MCSGNRSFPAATRIYRPCLVTSLTFNLDYRALATCMLFTQVWRSQVQRCVSRKRSRFRNSITLEGICAYFLSLNTHFDCLNLPQFCLHELGGQWWFGYHPGRQCGAQSLPRERWWQTCASDHFMRYLNVLVDNHILQCCQFCPVWFSFPSAVMVIPPVLKF